LTDPVEFSTASLGLEIDILLGDLSPTHTHPHANDFHHPIAIEHVMHRQPMATINA
jgi:hypothetical protein